jgi:hypothetical protein
LYLFTGLEYDGFTINEEKECIYRNSNVVIEKDQMITIDGLSGRIMIGPAPVEHNSK